MSSDKENGKSWLRRTLSDLRGRDQDGDVILGYVEEGASRIAIGKNIIQIGTLVVPTVPVLAVLAVIVAALIFAAVNFLGPAQMAGRFNIAVAEIGVLDADSRMRASETGQLLSRWIFEELVAANQAFEDSNVVVWHDSLSLLEKRAKLGMIAGQTPEARADAASELASRVDADVVIYGHLTPPTSASALVLEFYVQPRVRAEANVTIGRYQLGEPIPVPEDFDSTDTVAKEALGSQVADRAGALFWLLLGLRDDLLGRSEQALATFRQAEEELVHWKEQGEGKEILYFFIGRSALFLRRYEEAEGALQKALQIDPSYARAQIVLAGVDLRRVQDRLQPPDGQALQQEDWEQAIVDMQRTVLNYQKGVELARDAHEPIVEMIARVALAIAYRLEGQIYFSLQEHTEANRFFDLAIAEIDQVLDPLAEAGQHRILAQAYTALGAAYLQQAEIRQTEESLQSSRALYEKALAAYTACMDQERRAPHDEILRSAMIADGCRPWSQYVEEKLAALP